jgi:hypothetical protein
MIQFIENIRASDQRTKMKWLIIFSSIAMIFVVIIWIAALRVITSNIEHPSIPVSVHDDTKVSISERLGNAFDELKKRTSTAFSELKNSLNSKPVEIKQSSE